MLRCEDSAFTLILEIPRLTSASILFFRLVARLRSRGRSRVLGHLPVNGEFFVRVLLAPGSAVGSRQVVVRRGILRLQLHRSLQRRNRIRKTLGRDQRSAQAEIRITKSRIQFGGAGKMLDGIRPLAVPPR